jgi:UDP-N-acetyl-D-glucosamine dehydrogenase
MPIETIVPAPRTAGSVPTLMTVLRRHQAHVGVIGLGYVGLPAALGAVRAGFQVTAFDVDEAKVGALRHGHSVLSHLPASAVADALRTDRFTVTADFGCLPACDAVLICVPTPLTRHREPDLSFVLEAARTIAASLRRGQLVVLESTTYPGTTEDMLKPLLERTGLRSGTDFFLAYAPEREDPGSAPRDGARIPRVVGGDGPDALALARALYEALGAETVPVSSAAAAEATKLAENVFRAVNIALVNELKVVYGAMGIDIWEVIEAAKTKPFGFMPFYPGPGLGGHCIPIDPFYLTWKAREFDVPTRFIELAGEINTHMPQHVVGRLAEAMDRLLGRGLSRSRVLILGAAYKKNIDDTRESPALRLIELLAARGAAVDYHDPHVLALPGGHRGGPAMRSTPLDPERIRSYDAVLIVTDHDAVDYAAVAQHAMLVVDTRNACAARGLAGDNIVKA